MPESGDLAGRREVDLLGRGRFTTTDKTQFPPPIAFPMEEVLLCWNVAEPGSVCDLRISNDPDFKTTLVQKTGHMAPEFIWSPPPVSGITYFWQVVSRPGEKQSVAANGPYSFTMNTNVPSSLRGVILKAPLAEAPAPQEGLLLSRKDVPPTVGRDGAAQGALAFNGSSLMLVYDAPQFPLRSYTFAAWFCPQGLTVGRRWHHIVSAWCENGNDPLRISLQDKELVVSIEQPPYRNGSCRLSGGRVENDNWVHVAVVKKDEELRVYINGKQVGRGAVPAFYLPGPKKVGIGCNPNGNGNEAFRGALSEVVFVREELSEEDIRHLAAP